MKRHVLWLAWSGLLAGSLLAKADTEEQINKRFAVQPGGKVVVDVDFGGIQVNTNASNEVVVDVFRKVKRKSKADEEAFLSERAVTFSQDGNTITIISRGKSKNSGWWSGWQRNEGKYTITVPARFNAQLKTSGGSIEANDLEGEVHAKTSGGGLKFARLHGPLHGDTSGGSIRVTDCEGDLDVETSGGGIDVNGGSGAFKGDTSGGSITVKTFRGPISIETSGGGLRIEDVAGKIEGSTSGGSIQVKLSEPVTDEVRLHTSGGGITFEVPANSAFQLDASTSAGSVSSDLPVAVVGKVSRSHLKGPVNGGGKPVILHSSGGSVKVKQQ